MKNPVTRLNKCTVELSNGVSFVIIHNMKMNGHIDTFDAAFDNWLARTDEYTGESFVRYVKSKRSNCVFIMEEDYNAITNGKVEPATEEEYLSENN